MGYLMKYDLHGQVFGRLTVLEYAGIKGRHASWLCKCECGVSKVFKGTALRNSVKSCGCLTREISRQVCIKRNTTHGLRYAPGYSSWKSMINRVLNGKDPSYKHYGGRGIKVCERWHSFENFLADMGPRPEGYTLERIDVNGDYSHRNCKWATRREQGQNTRRNRYITFEGKTQCVAAWARQLGHASPKTLLWRLNNGWLLERALT